MKGYSCPIVGSEKEEYQESSFTLLNSLLQSRMETGHESTDDEDVNIYLAGLLNSFSHGEFYRERGKLVSGYESDVSQMIADACDERHRMDIFRANADLSLLASSVFSPRLFNGVRRPDREEFSEGALVERGSLYYRLARDIYSGLRRGGGLPEVLTKLSERLPIYSEILSHMAPNFLNIMVRLTDAEVSHLQSEAYEGAKPVLAKFTRDTFLDAYSEWARTKSRESREQVNLLAGQLRELDPNFKFDDL